MGRNLLYISDLEKVGFIIVGKNVIKRSRHRTYCHCDINYNGDCYKGIMCLYDNGTPPTLSDVLGNSKEEAYQNLTKVNKMMARYTAANTNGLGDIAKSRFLLKLLEIFSLSVCVLAIAYCILCSITYGITLQRTIALFGLFLLFHITKYVRIHYLRKLGK